MSYTEVYTESSTFTVTNARHIATKVSADLKRMQRFYGEPSDVFINNCEEELIALLKAGYLNKVTYGYKRDEKYIEPTLQYTAQDLALIEYDDDDPGRVRPGADVAGASFYSFLTYSSKWFSLNQEEKDKFNEALTIKRSHAEEPGSSGYFIKDKTYSSGGKALSRASMRAY